MKLGVTTGSQCHLCWGAAASGVWWVLSLPFLAMQGRSPHGELLWDILGRLWARLRAPPAPPQAPRRHHTPPRQQGILQNDETPRLDSSSGRENTLPVLSLGPRHLAALPAALVAFPFPALQGPAKHSFSRAREGISFCPLFAALAISSEALPGAATLLPAEDHPPVFLFLRENLFFRQLPSSESSTCGFSLVPERQPSRALAVSAMLQFCQRCVAPL